MAHPGSDIVYGRKRLERGRLDPRDGAGCDLEVRGRLGHLESSDGLRGSLGRRDLRGNTTADPFIHTSGMTGEVTFEVTEDVVAGADFGWLIKKELEGQSGQVEYFCGRPRRRRGTSIWGRG